MAFLLSGCGGGLDGASSSSSSSSSSSGGGPGTPSPYPTTPTNLILQVEWPDRYGTVIGGTQAFKASLVGQDPAKWYVVATLDGNGGGSHTYTMDTVVDNGYVKAAFIDVTPWKGNDLHTKFTAYWKGSNTPIAVTENAGSDTNALYDYTFTNPVR